jgi:hypothetical protein
MVRNGRSVILFPNWLLSNIIYGTKWLWCKIHMVRNGFCLWYYDQFVPGDTKQSRLESTTEITQNKHVKVLHYFVDDIKWLK